MKRLVTAAVALLFAALGATPGLAQDRPNILVVWGDDIGQSNISAYTMGLVGYRTPNIDRIANEGMIFTDYYGEQSCTAGRSSFIMGQSVFRTGLSKVGLPGCGARHAASKIPPSPSSSRISATPPASSARIISVIATTCCRPTTASTNSTATSITSTPKKSPKTKTTRPTWLPADGRTFAEAFGPRGVIHSYADGRIEDTGPLTRRHAWRRSTTRTVRGAPSEFIRNAQRRPERPGSSGGAAPACISAPT